MRKSRKSNEYFAMHKALRKQHGKATKCENEFCKHPAPKGFEWALMRGKQYSDNIDDYMQLCNSCHQQYDIGRELKDVRAGKSCKLPSKPRGTIKNNGEGCNLAKLTDETVTQIISLSGSKTRYELADMFNISYSQIGRIVTGSRWKHLLTNQ